MDFVEKRIREEKEKEAKIIEQALARTPKEYHDFVLLLKENKKLFTFDAKLNDELKGLGAWTNKEGTFLTLQQPYMSTAGRTLWWMKEHQKEDGTFHKFEITSNVDDLCRIIAEKGSAPAQFPLVVRVNSEKFGVLEDVSTIFWGGTGANKTNPLENAYTSALGRIYGRVGIGLLGTGVASAEEVENALRQQGLLAGSEPASNALPKAVGGEDSPPDRPEGKVLQMRQRDTFTVISETRMSDTYRMAKAVNSAGEVVAIAVNKGEFSKGSVIIGTYQVSEPARDDRPARLIVVPTSIKPPPTADAPVEETPASDAPAEEAAPAPPAEETLKLSADAEKKPEPDKVRRELVLTAVSDAKIRQVEPNPPACYFDARESDHEGVCLVYMEPETAEVFSRFKTVQPGDRVKGVFEEFVGVKGYCWNVVEFHGITRG